MPTIGAILIIAGSIALGTAVAGALGGWCVVILWLGAILLNW